MQGATQFLSSADQRLIVQAEHDVGLALMATGDIGLVPSLMASLGFAQVGTMTEDVLWQKQAS